MKPGSDHTEPVFFSDIMKILFDYNRTIFDPDTGKLFPGVPELLRDLSRQHELFLLSKNERGRGESLEKLGIAPLFRAVRFTDRKTEGDFRTLLGDPSGTLVVGDRARGELAIGKRLGCVTVWVRNGKFADEFPEAGTEPTYVIGDFRELRDIIRTYES